MKTMEIDEVCCENFKSISLSFNWMTYDDNGKVIYVMPHLRTNHKWRVNYCPICGVCIRDIKLTSL